MAHLRWMKALAALAATSAALLAVPVSAQEAAPGRGLETRITLYGWFPGVSGTTQFPAGRGASFNVDAADLLDKLDMAFMGTVEVRGARWGALADWVYTDVSANRTASRGVGLDGRPLPAGVTADVGLGVKTNILTLAGTYALVESEASSFGSVVGARMLAVDQTLSWSLSAPAAGVARSGATEASKTNWDGILGIRGRVRFGGDLRWFVPYYADIGTGSSKLTWQALIGLGYAFGPVEVQAAWRYLDYEMKNGQPIQSLTFNGAAVGVSVRF